jgi:hypothetical protein
MTRASRLAIGAAVVVAVVLVAAVALAVRQQHLGISAAASPSGTVAGNGSASGTAKAASPFTGEPVTSGRRVLAVKIDNVTPARPQTGLGAADIVYMEQVEGGLSRLMALYSSTLPERVGPVRSARESDVELLAQFGHPALAFSGANAATAAEVRESAVIDLEQSADPSAYTRSATRAAPHNLYADPRAILTRGGPPVSPAQDIGFRFGPLPAGLGTRTTRRTVRYPAATVSFHWSAAVKGWEVTLDGRPDVVTDRSADGGRLAPATVVVQDVSVTSSGLHDTLGNATPYTHTVGSGKATVLRDGVAIPATWSRPTATSGTTFTAADGQVVPFAQGQVWVVFAKS